LHLLVIVQSNKILTVPVLK